MGIDLTRFDFHVTRFMNSYDVESMTAEEVGQYILLLCKAWMMGKDACLPDDIEYLSRHARVKKVSALVLSKFPIIETVWGPRRRNETLYGEWLASVERSASASERGKKGSEGRWGNGRSNAPSITPSNSTGDSRGNGLQSTQSFQSNQTNHTNSDLPDSGQGWDFKNIRTHWYQYFKKVPSRSGRNKEQYSSACGSYGEDRVLSYLEKWAKSNDWVTSHPKGENRLYVFLQALPAMVSGDDMRAKTKKKENPIDLVALEARLKKRDEIERAKEIELEKQEADLIEANRGKI